MQRDSWGQVGLGDRNEKSSSEVGDQPKLNPQETFTWTLLVPSQYELMVAKMVIKAIIMTTYHSTLFPLIDVFLHMWQIGFEV